MEQDSVVLEARGLEFGVGGAVAVGPVDLEVRAGRTLGIVGETGSGKTLLCRVLVGVLGSIGGSVRAGSLVVGGADVTGAGAREWAALRRGVVGFMPQASLSGLNPVRRVGAQMEEALRAQGVASRGERRERARTLLGQVRMPDPERVLKSYSHELSGGMRQRVMLALALAGDPMILVADEPTTALDATVQTEVLDVIKDVQRARHMAVVTVSHDMRVVRRTCDAVAVMYAGRIVEHGPTARVLSEPSHPYTRALLAADPALAERGRPLNAISGAPRPPQAWHDGGCAFRERCAFATALCGEVAPPLHAVAERHAAACHHAQQVAAA
jgi:oligopeptide/dipeptide ABC transporter ATP-binding protein